MMKYHRWLHYLAILTVLTALPLLLLGAEVTSRQAGMVDPQGFWEPWHLAVISNLWERGIGFIIEHSHREFAWTVGLCCIILAVGLWRREERRWVRWLGVSALAAVIVQGLLGGFRVQLNILMGPSLAFVHGCFAQLVFSLFVTVAIVTSRSWITPTSALPSAETLPLRRWSLYTSVLVFLQILLGAIVRRTYVPWGPRLHVLFAFVVVAAVVWLVKTVLESPARDRGLVRSITLLGGLVALQLMLGMETWLGKFWIPEMQNHETYTQLKPLLVHSEGIRSLHYLVGSFLFATTVAITVQAYRRLSWATEPMAEPVGHLEGVV